MAEDSSRGATPWLAFLVGALLVAVAVAGYFVFADGRMAQTRQVDMNLKAPQIEAPAVPADG